MKNIIHVFGSLNLGGAESRIMDVYRLINTDEFSFDFISLDSSPNQFFENEILKKGGQIYKVPSPRSIGIFNHLILLVKVFKQNNKNGKLIVHSHTLYHSGVVMLAAKLSSVKIRISHARSTQTIHKSFISQFNVFMGKLLIKLFSTHKIAISEEAASFLFGKSCLLSKNVIIIPNAIDYKKYLTNSKNELLRLKKQYNIKEGTLVFGHVGRFEEMKNHKMLISIFFELLKNHPNSLLVLIGDGKLKAEIMNIVENLDIDKNVLFLGLRNDVHLWMKMFDVLIVPSTFEGLCSIAIEAQAAGTACVLSSNIPKASDMELGLVTYLSIEEPLFMWVNAIEAGLLANIPNENDIIKKFEEKNYTLEKEIQMLTNIYLE